MSKQTEALKRALEQTLEMLSDNREYIEANERAEYLAMYDKAIAGAEKALAEQPAQQEAVAYGMWDTMLGKDNRMMMVRLDKGQDGCTVPLYTAPQAQPAREPLTDEEIKKSVGANGEYWASSKLWIIGIARAIEAKLKENT